jgi:hypothetical protein
MEANDRNMPELFVLLLLIILSLSILLYCIKDGKSGDIIVEKEEFTNLQACPFGYTKFYNENGNMLCCNGTIVGKRCISGKKSGPMQCILNGESSGNIKNCAEVMKQQYDEKSKSQCPSTMKYYFEDNKNKIKGCSSVPLNDTMTGPREPNKPMCRIYPDLNTNIRSSDSCYNYRKVDQAESFGVNSTKKLITLNPNAPPVVAIDFADQTGIIRRAYTKDSYRNYLDVVKPKWREQGINLDRNIIVAEVAKKVYIDRTMSPSEVQVE